MTWWNAAGSVEISFDNKATVRMIKPMQVREIPQQFIRLPGLPQMELRSTVHSTQGYKAHSHQEFSIGYLHSGTTCLTIDGRQYPVRQGDLVIIEPGRVHACNPIDEGSRGYYMLYIDIRWCLGWLSKFYSSDVKAIRCEQFILGDSDLNDTFLQLVSALADNEAEIASFCLERLAPQLLLPFCTPITDNTEVDEKADTIKQFLLDNLTDPLLLSQIAGQVGYTQEGLIRIFRRSFGITPKAFLSNARIEYAKSLLRQGMPLADVAQSCGFSDQSQFHRTFVSYAAATPRQYQGRSISDNN